MRLVWHIAKKDLRRMALPVGLWLGFIAATAIWFQLASPASPNQSVTGTGEWLAMMAIWTPLIGMGQLIVGYLLAGALILEDPLVGTDLFWMTRPVTNGRLLAAKLLGGSILFVVGPAVALGVVDLANGFTLRELWFAMSAKVLWLILVTVPALLFASLARTLAQFLFNTIAVIVGCFLCAVLAGLLFHLSHVSFPNFLIGAVSWTALAAVVLVQRFLTRYVARTWLLIGIALPVGFLIASSFTRIFSDGRFARENRFPREHTLPPEVAMTVKRTSLHIYGSSRFPNQQVQANLTLVMTPAVNSEGLFYAPVGGNAELSGPGGQTSRISFRHGGAWGDDAALHAVLGTGEVATWNLYGMADDVTPNIAEAKVAGYILVWAAKPRILGELPVQLGAEFSRGANRLRIVAIESPQGWEGHTAVIEEHDSRLAVLDDEPPLGVNQRARNDRNEVFLLVNRAAGRAQVINCDELGFVDMSGQIVGFRRLYIPKTTDADSWLSNATIVKVRLEHEAQFARSFEVSAPVKDDK